MPKWIGRNNATLSQRRRYEAARDSHDARTAAPLIDAQAKTATARGQGRNIRYFDPAHSNSCRHNQLR